MFYKKLLIFSIACVSFALADTENKKVVLSVNIDFSDLGTFDAVKNVIISNYLLLNQNFMNTYMQVSTLQNKHSITKKPSKLQVAKADVNLNLSATLFATRDEFIKRDEYTKRDIQCHRVSGGLEKLKFSFDLNNVVIKETMSVTEKEEFQKYLSEFKEIWQQYINLVLNVLSNDKIFKEHLLKLNKSISEIIKLEVNLELFN